MDFAKSHSTIRPCFVAGVTLVLVVLHIAMLLVGWWAGWAWGIAGLVVLGLGLTACTLTPHCPAFGRAKRRFFCSQRSVILTIDDGPCEDTDEILRLLAAHRARAVFFLIGERASSRPDDVRRILEAGHLVGNHTYSHPSHWYWSYSPWRQRREVGKCQQVLAQMAGTPPTLFRAPAGFRNPYCNLIAAEFGLKVIGWHVRGFDGVATPVEIVLKKLERRLCPGAILLVHQGMPHSCQVMEGTLRMLEQGGWSTHLPGDWVMKSSS